MTEFVDLSPYTYMRNSPSEKNVGWLGSSTAFAQAVADEEFLDLLWQYCKISVTPTRGIHDCELCSSKLAVVERRGERLLLGSAEIRVFSNTGAVYAAPNLIFHYVEAHYYCPPDEFVEAVKSGPRPGSDSYLELLSRLELQWERARAPSAEAGRRLKAVKTDQGIRIVKE